MYNTVKNSGLGHVSCGSCHVDARMDGLAWDLGNPPGEMEPIEQQNLGFGHPVLGALFFEEHHPMKGPMVTQTLQDIIGKEPLHWRGDRDSLANFNPAFENLQSNDSQLTTTEMQEFSDFLASIHFPPNPHRNLDNSLSERVSLAGQLTTRLSGEPGVQLPDGNAKRGLELFQPPNRLAAADLSCNSCHTMPTGLGTNSVFDGKVYQPFPSENGIAHHGLVSSDGMSNVTIKVPQLRNLYEKVGMEVTTSESTRGFGFGHDGAFWSLAQVLTPLDLRNLQDQADVLQDPADVIAFLMSFSGSDLPVKDGVGRDAPPGTFSKDSHAGVGQQLTPTSTNMNPEDAARLHLMVRIADQQRLRLVLKGHNRGYVYLGNGLVQTDKAGKTLTLNQLLRKAKPDKPLTLTLVPKGSEIRIGIDRDNDGIYDRDELDHGKAVAEDLHYSEDEQARR